MTTDLNRVTESESQARENTRAELVMYNEFNSISCSDDSPESRNRPTIGGQSLRLYDRFKIPYTVPETVEVLRVGCPYPMQ